MNWKEQLIIFNQEEKWESGVNLLIEAINNDPNDFDAYLNIIHFLIEIINEPYELPNPGNYYEGLLNKYYYEANWKYSEDPEFLFYASLAVEIAPWYVSNDLDDEYVLSMTNKALSLDPENILYKWGVYYNGAVEKSMPTNIIYENCAFYAKEILDNHPEIIKQLESKGLIGQSFINGLKFSIKNNQEYKKHV